MKARTAAAILLAAAAFCGACTALTVIAMIAALGDGVRDRNVFGIFAMIFAAMLVLLGLIVVWSHQLTRYVGSYACAECGRTELHTEHCRHARPFTVTKVKPEHWGRVDWLMRPIDKTDN